MSKYSASFEVTLSMAAEAHSAGDVLADFQEITNFFRHISDNAEIDSIEISDNDDQGAAMEIYFANESTSLGTEGGAVSISAANAEKIKATVEVAASDYTDLINSKQVSLSNLGKRISGTKGNKSIWIGAVTRGTPTPTASGITLKIGAIYP